MVPVVFGVIVSTFLHFRTVVGGALGLDRACYRLGGRMGGRAQTSKRTRMAAAMYSYSEYLLAVRREARVFV